MALGYMLRFFMKVFYFLFYDSYVAFVLLVSNIHAFFKPFIHIGTLYAKPLAVADRLMHSQIDFF